MLLSSSWPASCSCLFDDCVFFAWQDVVYRKRLPLGEAEFLCKYSGISQIVVLNANSLVLGNGEWCECFTDGISMWREEAQWAWDSGHILRGRDVIKMPERDLGMTLIADYKHLQIYDGWPMPCQEYCVQDVWVNERPHPRAPFFLGGTFCPGGMLRGEFVLQQDDERVTVYSSRKWLVEREMLRLLGSEHLTAQVLRHVPSITCRPSPSTIPATAMGTLPTTAASSSLPREACSNSLVFHRDGANP